MLRYFLCFITLTLSLNSLKAYCYEFIVLESTQDTYIKGQLFSSNEPITLDDNKTISVIGDDGNLVLINGPFTGRVGDKRTNEKRTEGGVGSKLSAFMTSLSMLLTSKQETQLGATRSLSLNGIGDFTDNLDPWMIDITQEGHKCVNNTLPLLRRLNEEASVITFTSMLNNSSQQLHIPRGSAKIQWPSKLAVKDKDKYQVQLASSYKTHEIVFHKSKQGFKNPTFAAIWMAGKGCQQQANNMLSTLQVHQVIE